MKTSNLVKKLVTTTLLTAWALTAAETVMSTNTALALDQVANIEEQDGWTEPLTPGQHRLEDTLTGDVLVINIASPRNDDTAPTMDGLTAPSQSCTPMLRHNGSKYAFKACPGDSSTLTKNDGAIFTEKVFADATIISRRTPGKGGEDEIYYEDGRAMDVISYDAKGNVTFDTRNPPPNCDPKQDAVSLPDFSKLNSGECMSLFGKLREELTELAPKQEDIVRVLATPSHQKESGAPQASDKDGNFTPEALTALERLAQVHYWEKFGLDPNHTASLCTSSFKDTPSERHVRGRLATSTFKTVQKLLGLLRLDPSCAAKTEDAGSGVSSAGQANVAPISYEECLDIVRILTGDAQSKLREQPTTSGAIIIGGIIIPGNGGPSNNTDLESTYRLLEQLEDPRICHGRGRSQRIGELKKALIPGAP